MGDSAIINIIKQNGEIFITNDMIVDGCRYLTWIFVSKILAPIAAACEGLYDAAFDLVTFGTSTRVGTFIRSAGVVFTAIMMLSLMMLGITFILWHEKKPQLVINLVVLVLTTASSGYLMAQMSSAVTTGKDAILGSTSSAQTYETISNSFYDLRYIDQAVGLGNVSKPYPTRTMTKEEFNAIDINEVINPKSDGLSSDAKSILGKHLVNSIGGESLEKVSDGLTFYNSGASNGIMNGYYYRYHWETWNIILTLAGSLLLYLAMAYKVIRIEFELGVYRVLAYIEAANLNNTQKALKVLDAIKNSFLKLLNRKPINKITVKEIVEDCGINRNSFYYHFDDIPSLMEEIFNEQADEFVSRNITSENLYDILMEAIEFSLENKTAIMHIVNSPNRNLFDRYLNRVAQRTVTEFFDNLTGDLKTMKAEDREAIVMYYKSLLIGFVFEWISDGARYDLSSKIKRICELFEGTTLIALGRCERGE